MGFSISWVAIQSDDHSSVFEMLGVEPTGEEDEFFESKFSGAALKNGWFLLVGQRCQNRLVREDVLRQLSGLGAVIACSIEEHVMFSSAEMWNSGAQIWAVSHDAEEGMFNLEASGLLPASFEGLQSRIYDAQGAEGGDSADVDLIFDVPLLLAAETTGFKHDEDCDCFAQKSPVVFLDRLHPGKRPWWKCW